MSYGHSLTSRELDRMRGLDWGDQGLETMVEDGILPEFSRDCIRREIPDPAARQIGQLDILFDREQHLNLGGLEVVFIPCDSPHTEDSILVHIPEQGVVFLGDVIYGRRFQGIYGYRSKQFIAMVDQLFALDVQWYLVSHMEPLDRAGFRGIVEPMREIAGFVGNRGDLNACLQEFRESKGRELYDDERLTMEFFTAVNCQEPES